VDHALVLWSCVIVLALVGVVVVLLFTTRRRTAERRRRERDFAGRWLGLLISSLDHVPPSLPRIDPGEMTSFLLLWNRVSDSIRDGSSVALRDVAELAGADQASRRLLRARSVRDRLLAIMTIGRLKDKTMWAELLALAGGTDPTISIAAAHALLRIDACEAAALLLPMVANRDDWPPAKVAQMLAEAGSEAISQPFIEAARSAAPEEAYRLLRFLRLAEPGAVAALLRLLIRRVEHVESITACLRAFTDGRDLGAIHPFLSHPRWEVRVRVAEALGRLGTAQESGRLMALLSDPEWWVRYRAAGALCSLFAGDPFRVARVRDTHRDPFARDMLAHVMAERGFA
jgi:HEAT repeat protein